MFSETDFRIHTQPKEIVTASFEWSAPSNIALVKYWGKKEHQLDTFGNTATQIPANPSLSFTLKNCKTITKTTFTKKNRSTAASNLLSFEFLFEGAPKTTFNPKIATFLDRIVAFCPYLKEYQIVIDSKNTFPHSSGIASSASSMAALSVNIMSLEKQLYPDLSEERFYAKASFLARLGSGSACRSIKGNTVIWGKHDLIPSSTNLFGVPTPFQLHTVFENYQDTILLVDKGEKQVSSSVGHNLMHNHPFAANRFEQAHQNLSKLVAVLKNGDLDTFIEIVESEAITLHAMMMTSLPYFVLMKPNTLAILNTIWEFRRQSKIPICFTLDAGANVHVLYPKSAQEKTLQFIKDELVVYCQNGQYICDEMGFGAIEN